MRGRRERQRQEERERGGGKIALSVCLFFSLPRGVLAHDTAAGVAVGTHGARTEAFAHLNDVDGGPVQAEPAVEDEALGRTRHIPSILSRTLGSQQCAQCTLMSATRWSPTRFEEERVWPVDVAVQGGPGRHMGIHW